ncbi:endonuclease domain-containing protein [Pseudolysinimonas sp.]|uniref:endonuclease domain-containing protein n=1 Tax=Pseudolysinimonas sp. TaxID=2680009 RepID=UPI003F7EBAAB
MTGRVELPGELPEAFTVPEARAAGVSRGRLRAGDLRRPFRGGRSLVDDRLTALLPLMRDDHAFAGPTAARLHRLPIPRRWERDDRVHVVALTDRRMRRPGVVGTRSVVVGVTRVRGLPVLDPVSTWVSLSTMLETDELVAVADRIVTGDRDSVATATLDDLRSAVDRVGRRRGVVGLHTALPWVRVGAWSPAETALRLLIVRAGLPEPELNAVVPLADGGVVRPDLSWASRRVAVEYDGSAFHGRDRWDRDAARHERLVDAGWLVVRVRADDLYRHPDRLVARLHVRLASRAVTPAR